MHPAISSFPSKYFYGNVLEAGLDVSHFQQQFHSDKKFGPLVFYDVKSAESRSAGSTSLKNDEEANFVIHLVEGFWRDFEVASR